MKLKTSPENCESRSGSACLAWWRHLAIVLLLLAFVACGSDDETAGGSSEETQGIAITDKQVAGVSQKGPFVKGSSVTVQELKNGTTLAQTGRSFKGKIASDKGDFSIKVDSLVSQYALLQVDGYYYNEITGVKSSSIISLNALTDLSDRDNVNINLLTHLAYDRVLHLVDSGASVSEAKIQAEAEIFNAFEITGDFDAAEDLNIFSNRDGDAALLAISVLLLGDRSEADLTELMTMFSMDMEKDGIWDDEPNKAKIADWASETTVEFGLPAIRANVTGWSFGVPQDFEKHVKNFWYMNYKLGVCDESREGEVAADSNAISRYYYKNSTRRFICNSGEWKVYYEPTSSEDAGSSSSAAETGSSAAEISSSSLVCSDENEGEIVGDSLTKKFSICDAGEWREATNFEYDTYQWEDGYDGELRVGLSGEKYIYDMDHWRVAGWGAEREVGGCTEAIAADSSRRLVTIYSNNWFCRNREWVLVFPYELDTLGWTPGSDGEIRHAQDYSDLSEWVIRGWYVYEGADSVWRIVSESESAMMRGGVPLADAGCTTLRVGAVILKPSDNAYYECQSGHKWIKQLE